MKHKLNNELSSFNQFNFYIIGIILIGIFIYNLSIKYYFGIALTSIVLILFYFTIIRKMIKAKEIEFDEDYIYFDEKKISYTDIISIKPGIIILEDDFKKKSIFFNFSHFGSKYSLLEEFYNNHNQTK